MRNEYFGVCRISGGLLLVLVIHLLFSELVRLDWRTTRFRFEQSYEPEALIPHLSGSSTEGAND